MAAAVVQRAAERELLIAGELAAANGPHKIGSLSRQECPLYPQKRTLIERVRPKADILMASDY